MAPARKKAGASSTASGSKAGSSAASSPSSSLPAPFHPLPASLRPALLSQETSLGTPLFLRGRVYIVHLDASPLHDAAFKRRIFTVPVALHVAVAALLACRLWFAVPWYAGLVRSALGAGEGGSTESTTAAATSGDAARFTLYWLVARRALVFLADYAAAVLVWPWPFDFVLGTGWVTVLLLWLGLMDGRRTDVDWHGSPVLWRWSVGFRDREVVVRRSRAWWDAAVLGGGGGAGSDAATPLLADDEGAAARRRTLLAHVLTATDPALLRGKTGYLLMGREWDLDWAAMAGLTRLVDGGGVKGATKGDAGGNDEPATLSVEALVNGGRRLGPGGSGSALVLLHAGGGAGWVCVDVGRLRGEASTLAPASTTTTTGGADAAGSTTATTPAPDAERRDQVFAFRDALAAVGKEDLFFRWVELVQFEASRPGPQGFDAKRQTDVAKQVRKLFESQGVDFDVFWKEAVGGGADAASGLGTEDVVD